MSNTTFQNLQKIKELRDLNFIVNELSVHPFTVKRWEQLKRVPKHYDIDIQKLVDKIYNENSNIDLVKISNSNSKNLDQFYTTKDLAKKCFATLNKKMKDLGVDEKQYTFIEPSAGAGNIFNLLPKNRRIGVELVYNEDKKNDYIFSDYLDYTPKNKNCKYIVFGNPPFGLRGNMALRFINHSNKFADIVAFILPPMFNSDGKGTPKNRVEGYKLFFSENLLLQTFEYPDGSIIKLSVCFQIWTKINLHKIIDENQKSVDNYIKVFSLSNGENSKDQRNVKMIDKCDFYLPSTCFGKVEIKKSFNDLPYNRGYGIKILKDYSKIYKTILNFDWDSQAMLSVNSSKNFRKSLIQQALISSGIHDD